MKSESKWGEAAENEKCPSPLVEIVLVICIILLAHYATLLRGLTLARGVFQQDFLILRVAPALFPRSPHSLPELVW